MMGVNASTRVNLSAGIGKAVKSLSQRRIVRLILLDSRSGYGIIGIRRHGLT